MDDEQKKKQIEEEGHDANPDNGELEALEPIGNKDDAEAGESNPTSLPDEADDVEENIFSDAD